MRPTASPAPNVIRFDKSAAYSPSKAINPDSLSPKQPPKKLRWMDEVGSDKDAYDEMQKSHMKTSQKAARDMVASLQPSSFLSVRVTIEGLNGYL
jgi:hypothetical protein